MVLKVIPPPPKYWTLFAILCWRWFLKFLHHPEIQALLDLPCGFLLSAKLMVLKVKTHSSINFLSRTSRFRFRNMKLAWKSSLYCNYRFTNLKKKKKFQNARCASVQVIIITDSISKNGKTLASKAAIAACLISQAWQRW